MEYRSVGASGLKVSYVSIGGWITFGGSIADEDTDGVLKAALDEGINFIDLADVYARGAAEVAAGKSLQGLPRHELVLSSKLFWPMSDDPNDRGLSRKHIIESVERSLKNLGTDYLDIYFCHREDPDVPLEETICAMDDLVHQGKILYWGTSVWPAESLQAAHDLADRRCLYAPRVEQPEFSLMKRDIERDVLPKCRELGMGIVCWSPLAGGMLTGKYNDGIPEGSRADTSNWMASRLNDENLQRVRAFCGIAKEAGHEPGQLALAWALQKEGISCVITGATHPDQVKSNVRAAEIELSGDLVQSLEDLFPL